MVKNQRTHLKVRSKCHKRIFIWIVIFKLVVISFAYNKSGYIAVNFFVTLNCL